MVKWELTENEVAQLQSFLNTSLKQLEDKQKVKPSESVEDKIVNARRLFSSLKKAALTLSTADFICYCDTNYNFASRTLSISYRIGDEEVTHTEATNVNPPPDEYLGIQAVLRALDERQIKGKVILISDSSRNVIAMQMALQHRVDHHTPNQSPRSVNFGFTFDETIALTKKLLADGCRVEFVKRHRDFINEVLGITRFGTLPTTKVQGNEIVALDHLECEGCGAKSRRFAITMTHRKNCTLYFPPLETPPVVSGGLCGGKR